MDFVCQKYSQLRLASVVDDRNFRGPTDTVVKAALDAVEFDRLAGLKNNIDKYVAVGNTSGSRNILRQIQLEG